MHRHKQHTNRKMTKPQMPTPKQKYWRQITDHKMILHQKVASLYVTMPVGFYFQTKF